jgi:hypothetical protein
MASRGVVLADLQTDDSTAAVFGDRGNDNFAAASA